MNSHHRHAHPEAGAEDAALTELLDLDAEVLQSYLSELTDWIGKLAAGLRPGRILDLGSGTGTGTFALLQRFAGAEVIALDISAPLLHRLSDKASVLGVADRVRTVQADLDAAARRRPPLRRRIPARIRSGLDGRVSADDLATLDALLDSDGPDSVLQRGDLTVRTLRTVWAARRPWPDPDGGDDLRQASRLE